MQAFFNAGIAQPCTKAVEAIEGKMSVYAAAKIAEAFDCEVLGLS